LVVNDKRFADRSEIIWEKGTNRSAFFRGEVDKYNWIDVGSSFLPSEITAAFLWAQIEEIDFIQEKRQAIWQLYYEKLKPLQEAGLLQLPQVPKHCKHNAHLFYILTKTADDRGELINHLKANNIQAVFHYLSLHQSPYFVNQYAGDPLTHTNCYSDRLIRLPMYVELSASEVQKVTDAIYQYFHA
ncbi:MAG: DegT/DnrJ/EryC1/StrS family aminotransferase, partial [Bacteroidota bacterium]